MLFQSVRMQSFNNFALKNNGAAKLRTTENDIKFQNVQNTKLRSYPANYYLPVSFGRLSNEELAARIGSENFPSPQIEEMFLANPDKSLYELHRQYYAPLLECRTLDEAKELYPEFKDVKDAKQYFEENKHGLHTKNYLLQVSKGEYEGISLETLSLDILQKYYGEVLNNSEMGDYFGVHSLPYGEKSVFKRLGIKKFGSEYGLAVAISNPKVRKMHKQSMSNVWQEKREKGIKGRERAKMIIDTDKYEVYRLTNFRQIINFDTDRGEQIEIMQRLVSSRRPENYPNGYSTISCVLETLRSLSESGGLLERLNPNFIIKINCLYDKEYGKHSVDIEPYCIQLELIDTKRKINQVVVKGPKIEQVYCDEKTQEEAIKQCQQFISQIEQLIEKRPRAFSSAYFKDKYNRLREKKQAENQ